MAPLFYLFFNLKVFSYLCTLTKRDMSGERWQGMSRLEIGREAEEIVLRFLKCRGMTLLAKNWRSRHREIDLIMSSSDGLHIVEVRSLRMPAAIHPRDTVSLRKQQLLIKAASGYILRHQIEDDAHFDIASVIFDASGYRVEYVPDAFIPFRRF